MGEFAGCVRVFGLGFGFGGVVGVGGTAVGLVVFFFDGRLGALEKGDQGVVCQYGRLRTLHMRQIR